MVQHMIMSANSSMVNKSGNSTDLLGASAFPLEAQVTEDPPIPFGDLTIPPCQWILYKDINNTGVRIWDVIILIPNCLFLLFLLYRLREAVGKLHASSSPIFTVFYGLVFAVCIISVSRCIVSMTVNATVPVGDITDKVLWLVLRFFLLATELSVVIFGLAFGHLDSRTSIRRVLMVTFTFALIYSSIQGTLEIAYDHPQFKHQTGGGGGEVAANATTTSYDLFAHGGMIFLFTTSIFFSLVYAAIVVLPFTRLRDRFLIPTKRLFYYYCSSLALLQLCQAIASLLLYLEFLNSLCVIDVTTYLYFSFYNPLVYAVFLWNFFKASQTGLQFSYKHQEDVLDDEQVSLPYSNGATKHEDHAPIYSYDSTHFDVQFSRSNSGGSEPNTSHRPSLSLNGDLYDFEGAINT